MFKSLSWPRLIITFMVYYVVTFVFGMVARALFPELINYFWWVVSIIMLFVMVRYFYFKEKPDSSWLKGLGLGILLLVITFIIEVNLLVYGFGLGWSLYSIWTVWIKYALVLIVPIITVKL